MNLGQREVNVRQYLGWFNFKVSSSPLSIFFHLRLGRRPAEESREPLRRREEQARLSLTSLLLLLPLFHSPILLPGGRLQLAMTLKENGNLLLLVPNFEIKI